jgi:hypothetical protein
MNKHHQDAASRLHEFAAENRDVTETELRAELESQGVNVDAFLARLGSAAGIEAQATPAKRPTAAERLRALASQAGNKVKTLLGDRDTDGTGLPAAAYGRTGRQARRARPSLRGKDGGRSSK